MAIFGGSKAVTAAGTPVKLGATEQRFVSLEVYARKSKAAANTGPVYIGFNNTPARKLEPDDVWTISVSQENYANLSQVWLDSDTNGDGVIFNGCDK